MFPLTQDKCLFSFLGESLLQKHLRHAKKTGLQEFIIVANPHNKSKIEEAVEDFEACVDIVIQEEPRGMGNALLKTQEIVANESILVVGGGEVFGLKAYQKIQNAIKKKEADAFLLAEEVEDYFPGGYLIIEEGEIKGIIEKPGEGDEPSNLVNVIMHYHSESEELFRQIKEVETKRDDEYERAMDRMIEEMTFKPISYSGWKAIKYPWHILEVMDHYLNKVGKKKIAESVEISKKATIDGSVWIGKGSKILEGAVIRGPTYIGKNTLVGNNALVRQSHICDETVIGFGSEVKHSYISEGTFIHDSYVGDSVLDKNCNLGAGTVLANWRFDEKEVQVKVKDEIINTHHEKLGAFLGANCKTGVNSSTMPGVRMGTGSRLGPNITLKRDLEKNEEVIRNK